MRCGGGVVDQQEIRNEGGGSVGFSAWLEVGRV